MAEQYYNLQQVVAILRTNRMTLREWLQDAHITPAQNPGNKKERVLTRIQIEQVACAHNRTLAPDTPIKTEDPLAALEARLKRYIDQRIAALRAELMDKLDTPEQPTLEVPAVRVSAPRQTARPTPPIVQQPSASPAPLGDLTMIPFGTFLSWHFVNQEEREIARQNAKGIINPNHLQGQIAQINRKRLIDRWHLLPGFAVCGRPDCACAQENPGQSKLPGL